MLFDRLVPPRPALVFTEAGLVYACCNAGRGQYRLYTIASRCPAVASRIQLVKRSFCRSRQASMSIHAAALQQIADENAGWRTHKIPCL